LALDTTRHWDDSAVAWWDDAALGWDAPVKTVPAYWETPAFDMATEQTGRVEAWGEYQMTNGTQTNLGARATYQRDGSASWGTNYPSYDNSLWETLTDRGEQAGYRRFFTSQINAAVRKVRVRFDFQSTAASNIVRILMPEVRFADTRIEADKLNLATAASASAGASGSLPATVAGYLVFQTPTGGTAKVPYYHA
jgi:hypothetical protein